jgi:peptidoglycan/LPS O-acetylase OafA/YrhL
MKKLVSIEWLRGLAALGVCVMHLFNATEYFTTNDTFFYTFVSPLTMIGRVGVPVFFVISGFIIPYSMWANKYDFPGSWANFMLRRITRIEPPYVLSMFVTLVVLAVSAALVGNTFSVDWLNVLGHLGYLNIFKSHGDPSKAGWILGVYWTLAVEFQYYLLISLLFPLLFLGDIRKNIISILLLLLISIPVSKWVADEGFIPLHIPLFLAGIVTFKFCINKIKLSLFLPLIVVVLFAIYAEFGILYTLSSIFTCFMIVLNIDFKFKFMYFLGTISYSLYLMHWTFGVEICLRTLQYYFPNAESFLKIAIVLCSVAFSIGMSYVYYLIIEKPAIKWAKALK